ncbi:hypothetical protein MMPV_002560 [Pyropia vietnamensis]
MPAASSPSPGADPASAPAASTSVSRLATAAHPCGEESPTPAVLPDALYDVHTVKRALDDELIVLLEGSGYVERTGPIDVKLVLACIAIGASLYSHLAPGTYPQTRPLLLACVAVYVTGVVAILAIGFFVERDAFFCAVPAVRPRRLASAAGRRRGKKGGAAGGGGTGGGTGGTGGSAGSAGLPAPLPGGVYATSVVGKPAAGVPVAGGGVAPPASSACRSMYCLTLRTGGRSRAVASVQRPYEEYFTKEGVLLETRFAGDVAEVLKALKGKKCQ